VLTPERGKRFAPYDLRHVRATHLLEETFNVAGVEHLLGHAERVKAGETAAEWNL